MIIIHNPNWLSVHTVTCTEYCLNVSFFNRPPNMTIHFQAVCTTLREYKNTDIKLALESHLKSLSTNSGFNPPLINAEIFYNGIVSLKSYKVEKKPTTCDKIDYLIKIFSRSDLWTAIECYIFFDRVMLKFVKFIQRPLKRTVRSCLIYIKGQTCVRWNRRYTPTRGCGPLPNRATLRRFTAQTTWWYHACGKYFNTNIFLIIKCIYHWSLYDVYVLKQHKW